jgi:hypothetical protein
VTNITTPFAGTDTTAQTQTKLSSIANYWAGSSTALSGAGSWGAVRAILNNYANAANQINNYELASSFIDKLNWLNDSDNMFSDLFALGEDGFWYDPADAATVFTDTTGSTAAVPGNALALILDKHDDLALGPELVTNGTFDSGTTGWSSARSNSTLSVVSGSLQAEATTASAYGPVASLGVLSVGVYKLSFDYTIGSGNSDSFFRIADDSTLQTSGGFIAPVNTNLGAGPNSGAFEIIFTVTSEKQYYIGLIAAATSAGNIISLDNVSVKELSSYPATQATLAARPILRRVPEGGVRNLLLYTEQFDNAVWVKSSSAVSANAVIAPDGLLTADKLETNGVLTTHRISYVLSLSLATYTFTLYAQADEYEIMLGVLKTSPTAFATYGFSLTGSGSVAWTNNNLGGRISSPTATIEDVGGGWYRCRLTFTSLDAGGSLIIDLQNGTTNNFAGTAGDGCYIWGAQLEVGSTATAYQKVTNANDVTEAGKLSFYSALMDRIDDRWSVTLPTISGTMVLSTPEGTAAYGYSKSSGSLEIGGHTNGLYFPGTALVGQIVRDGAMTNDEINRTVQFWKAKGGGDDYGTVTNFSNYWNSWTEITSFPDDIDTSAGTNFTGTWLNCTGLTSFPLIDTSAGTNFTTTWYTCSGLTSFPALDTSSGTNFTRTWQGCSSLTSFPVLDTSAGTTFFFAWQGCSSLTSFPFIDTGAGATFQSAWQGCTGLTSFSALDTGSGTNFVNSWNGCVGLTSFPLIDTSAGTNFGTTWYNCTGLTSFPALDMSAGTSFSGAWQNCTNLASFPVVDVSAGQIFNNTWNNCSSLTSFPALDISSGTSFQATWFNCTSLTTFPANMFDTCLGTDFTNAFTNTNLSQTSIDNILVSLATSGQSTGTRVFNQSGGSAPSATGEAAIDTLRGLGWTVTVTGGY